MAVKAGGLESERIDRVCQLIREHLSEPEAALAEPFARQYYRWVPPDDLEGRGEEDLYATCLAHFRLALERPQGAAKLHVYRPSDERGALGSAHTFVDIVSTDMPFIVDSVTMALAREGYSLALQIHPVMGIRRDGEGRLLAVLRSEERRVGK